MLRRLILGLAIAVGLMGADFDWNVSKVFPRPVVPADNPMTAVKVELGRYLFYDRRMSLNGKESCATCHRQELAFTDGRARAEGATRATPSAQQYEPCECGVHPTIDVGKSGACLA